MHALRLIGGVCRAVVVVSTVLGVATVSAGAAGADGPVQLRSRFIGTAQADPQSPGPFQWCPGQPVPGTHAASVPGVNVKIPATHVVWDNSVCHTYWQTPYGRGNVPMSDGPVSEIWDGPDPPPYFEPVCAPFVPPINCRPQNG
jgi:hypothetical protein